MLRIRSNRARSSVRGVVRRLTSPVKKISGSTISVGIFSPGAMISGGAAPCGTVMRSSNSVGCSGKSLFTSTAKSSRFKSRGTTTRAAMDSSGREEGMLLCPLRGTMGNMAGTRVRSSSVVGRRRVLGASAEGGRALNGTRTLGIICLFSEPRQTLPVGRARHAPGCLSSRGRQVRGRRRQLFKGELRLRTRLFHGDAQRVAPGVIERDVFMLLEESYLADSFCGNAARRDIGDCAAGELEPGMRDVHFVAQNRNAHGLHLGHWLLDQGEQNVEIVNHQVIDNIHIQAARCEYSQAMHFEKQRVVEDGLDGQYRGIESFQMPDLQQALIAVCRIDESIRLG